MKEEKIRIRNYTIEYYLHYYHVSFESKGQTYPSGCFETLGDALEYVARFI